MAKGKLVFAAAVAAASLSAFAGTSQAVVYIESPDAGQTLTTAQTVPGGVTAIDGTLANPSDADLFKINLAGGTYTFSTTNTVTTTVDTELFLFDSLGHALLANNDANGTTVASSITTGTLTGGTYYIGVSSSNNEPVNSANQLLFATGLSTSTRGPASGLNPTTLAGFNSNEDDTTTFGAYEIGVTPGTAVPEPSTWAVVGASAAALAFLQRRRVA